MSIPIETLGALDRKMQITLPKASFDHEVQSRLGKIARQVRIDGFRPGKVPPSVVQKRYGSSVYSEVLEEQVQQIFTREIAQQQLRVAGITAMQPAADETDPDSAAQAATLSAVAGEHDKLKFDVLFEVFPEVAVPNLADIEVPRYTCALDEDAVERTLTVLRRQKSIYVARAATESVAPGDRVTLDFEGKVDGEAFAGGKAENFMFQTGQNEMLPEFETAVIGMKVGQSKAFPLSFPENYHGRAVAGKTADFMLTIKAIAAEQLPELNDTFVLALNVGLATVDALRKSIRENVAREVKVRLLSRNKEAVFGRLGQIQELAIPKVLVHKELGAMLERLASGTAFKKSNAKQRQEIMQAYAAQLVQPATQRVRASLLLQAIVQSQRLEPKPNEVSKYIEEMASSFEDPLEAIKLWGSDKQKLAEIETIVLENKALDYVYSVAQVQDQTIVFEELLRGSTPDKP